MGDRFYDDLENTLSSYSIRSTDDFYNDGEETEEEYDREEVNGVEIEKTPEELACPFCLEDFDVLGLCCHIDADHRLEVKPRICPVCATKVGINMASHVITQHESILKALCNKKRRGSRSRSSVLVIRKEMHEKHLRYIKESPSAGPSPDATSDSMFLSFVNKNPKPADRTISFEASSTTNASLAVTSSTDDYLEESKPPSLSSDINERTRKCEFLQGLILSTILDDL